MGSAKKVLKIADPIGSTVLDKMGVFKSSKDSSASAGKDESLAAGGANVVMPAVAHGANPDTTPTSVQEEAQTRLRGIRGTYNRYAFNEASPDGGTNSKLG